METPPPPHSPERTLLMLDVEGLHRRIDRISPLSRAGEGQGEGVTLLAASLFMQASSSWLTRLTMPGPR